MVLISSSPDDYSTNEVIEWLIENKKNFLRVTENDKMVLKSINLNEEGKVSYEIKFNNNEYSFTQDNSYWYRRGHVNFMNQIKDLNFSNQTKNIINSEQRLKSYLHDELEELGILFNLFQGEKYNSKAIGCYFNNFTVKIENLFLAKEIGLKIPNTTVTSDKKKAIEFSEKCLTGIISKAIRNGIGIYNEEFAYEGLTKEINKSDLSDLSDFFFPMLLQEKIDKIFEIRSFYLNKKFYTSAIFSQNDEKTAMDFRNYNESKPNRTPPFKLPNEIENKLIQLFEKLGMSSGSIDLIYNTSGEYIFLEVNPIGQFSQVSRPCNYYLEEIIANEL